MHSKTLLSRRGQTKAAECEDSDPHNHSDDFVRHSPSVVSGAITSAGPTLVISYTQSRALSRAQATEGPSRTIRRVLTPLITA